VLPVGVPVVLPVGVPVVLPVGVPVVLPVGVPVVLPVGALVRFPIGLNAPGGSLIILTGPLVLFVGVPELVLFCPPGINCVNPGKVFTIAWFGGLVLFFPPPPEGCKLFSAGFDNDNAGFDNDNAGFDNDNAGFDNDNPVLLLLLLDEIWFDGVEAFPFELWWDVFAYAAGALLSTDPIKKSVITAAVSIIVCFFILIIFLNFKLNNSSIKVKPVYGYKSSGRYIRKRRPG
jgi:hypothetical protein